MLRIGWFILLTSVLSYWRVKRWERSIITSSDTGSSAPSESPLTRRLRAAFGGQGMILRHGFSLSRDEGPTSPTPATISAETTARAGQVGTNTELVRPTSEPEVLLARAWAEEARLQDDLRAAGLM